jgi:hypothetical protein
VYQAFFTGTLFIYAFARMRRKLVLSYTAIFYACISAGVFVVHALSSLAGQSQSVEARYWIGIFAGTAAAPVLAALVLLARNGRVHLGWEPFELQLMSWLIPSFLAWDLTFGAGVARWAFAALLAVLGYFLFWSLVSYYCTQIISRLATRRALQHPRWLPITLSIATMVAATFAANRFHHYLEERMLAQ